MAVVTLLQFVPDGQGAGVVFLVKAVNLASSSSRTCSKPLPLCGRVDNNTLHVPTETLHVLLGDEQRASIAAISVLITCPALLLLKLSPRNIATSRLANASFFDKLTENIPIVVPGGTPFDTGETLRDCQTNHSAHGVDGIVACVVQVPRVDSKSVKYCGQTSLVSGSSDNLVHLASINKFDDIGSSERVVAQFFQVLNIATLVVEDKGNVARLACLGDFGVVNDLLEKAWDVVEANEFAFARTLR